MGACSIDLALVRHKALAQLPSGDEAGAEPFALAPDQQAHPKHLAAPGECEAEYLGHRHGADIQAGAFLGHIDNGALDPWRVGRRDQESRLVHVDPDVLALAEVLAVSRHG